jgi:F-box associated region
MAFRYKDTSTECAICLEPLDDVAARATAAAAAAAGASCGAEEDKNDNETIHSQPTTTTNTTSGQKKNKNSVIELTCGHLYHFQCIKDQIGHANPYSQRGSSQRILFAGCRCPKCSVYCDHPWLRHVTRHTDALRHKVDEQMMEPLQVDAPHVWKRLQELSSQTLGDRTSNQGREGDGVTTIIETLLERATRTEREQLLEEARRNYAFYWCKSCQEPYFGGTVECADDAVLGDDQQQQQSNNTTATSTATTSIDRLCVACAPQPQWIHCTAPVEHGASHVWKCRYCCQVATMVCYGNLHFCTSCHDRNTQRVLQDEQQQQQQQRQQRRHPGAIRIPRLQAIPCPGGEKCPYPKPTSRSSSSTNDASSSPLNPSLQYHKNGPTSDCEQVYYCAACQSSQQQHQQQQHQQPNLLKNPNGQEGLSAWQQHNPQMSWIVEEISLHDDLPRCPSNIRTHFVSSFAWCVMSQQVDLVPHLPPTRAEEVEEEEEEQDPRRAQDNLVTLSPRSRRMIRFEVTASVLARTDCPSVYCLEALVVGRARRRNVDGRDAPPLDHHVLQQQQQQQPQVLQHQSTGIRSAPCDAWEQVSLVIDVDATTLEYNSNNSSSSNNNLNTHGGSSTPPPPPQLVVIIRGKDSKFWQGRFGCKVTNLAVRRVVELPPPRPSAPDNDDEAMAPPPPPLPRQPQDAALQPPRQGREGEGIKLRLLIIEGILPILVLTVGWAWWSSYYNQ